MIRRALLAAWCLATAALVYVAPAIAPAASAPGKSGVPDLLLEVSTSGTPDVDERAIAARAHEMLPWIAKNSEHAVDGIELRIVFKPVAELRAACRLELAEACFLAGTILLRDDFRPGLDDSFLLHELVHLVQWENGNPMDDGWWKCLAEKEAYELQVKWAHARSGYIPNILAYTAITSCHWDY